MTLKSSLAQNLKFIFRLSTTMEQINVPLRPTWGMKDEERMGKIL